jgi:transposase InsO family protein
MTTPVARALSRLKREEIYANSYENLEHLRANIETFIEQYYNEQRPTAATLGPGIPFSGGV